MITNKIVVFSGPSGVGKATIEKELFNNKDLKLRLSCSATTREKREGEVDGIHYYFIEEKEFNKKIIAKEKRRKKTRNLLHEHRRGGRLQVLLEKKLEPKQTRMA